MQPSTLPVIQALIVWAVINKRLPAGPVMEVAIGHRVLVIVAGINHHKADQLVLTQGAVIQLPAGHNKKRLVGLVVELVRVGITEPVAV